MFSLPIGCFSLFISPVLVPDDCQRRVCLFVCLLNHVKLNGCPSCHVYTDLFRCLEVTVGINNTEVNLTNFELYV